MNSEEAHSQPVSAASCSAPPRSTTGFIGKSPDLAPIARLLLPHPGAHRIQFSKKRNGPVGCTYPVFPPPHAGPTFCAPLVGDSVTRVAEARLVPAHPHTRLRHT